MTDSNRIAALEAQINTAMAELHALKAGAPAPVPPREAEGTRVIPILDERRDMPTLKEMRRLYDAARPLSPWPLNDKYDADRPFRGFCCCVRWLANKGRSEQINSRFALSFWLDQCKNWLRDRGSMVGDIDASTLILAVYASGDIKFVPANPSIGTTWELALAEHAGRPASPDSWKRIMREGASAILPPSAPARRMQPSNVRITVGY